MSDAIAVYVLVAAAGLFVTVVGALSDAMSDSPRGTFRNLLRRSAYMVTWPVSLPVWLSLAVLRDKW